MIDDNLTDRQTEWRMPAERERHERCLMAWPTETRRSWWHVPLEAAREAYAAVAVAIARFEPVLMVVEPGEGAAALRALGGEVDVIELPIDDSWMRDNGPIVVVGPGGRRRGVDFAFNGWGDKLRPWTRDAAVGRLLCEHLSMEHAPVDVVLEGGAVAVDGAGTLVMVHTSVVDPRRNPARTPDELGSLVGERLGAPDVVWLPHGLAEDLGTNGHVDNVVAFLRERRCLLQYTQDESNPNRERMDVNRRVLEDAGITTYEIPLLPYASVAGRTYAVPYANFYCANGGIVVPVTGHARDHEILTLIGEAFGDHEVVGVPGEVLAAGGGGVHCITQQVPAAA